MSKVLIFFISKTAKIFLAKGGKMKLKNKIYNGTMYLVISGELDECSSAYVREEMDKAFAKEGFSQIIIDLAELDFMDSTGIGVLLGRYNNMKEKNIPIYICNPSKQAEKIFKITGLYNLMPKIV